MQKQKQKVYWYLIISLAIIGAGVIKIVDSNAYTEQKLNNPHLALNTLKKPVLDEIQLSVQEQVFDLLVNEGGMSFDEAMTGLMIVKLESRWDEYAIGDNGLSHGLWQIHEPSHPEITRACKFDVYCSTREAIKIYKDWNGWTAWSTYRLIK